MKGWGKATASRGAHEHGRWWWPRGWMWGTWAAWLAALLWPYRHAVPYAPDVRFSDMAVAHLPQILYLKRAWHTWHTLPLWSPTYDSGYPFYADPLSGLWYAPGWLGVVLPLPWGVTLTVGLHGLLGAWGMYVFLRGRVRASSAWLGALAWLGFSKMWAHWGAGHLSLLYAVAWTPWLLVAAARPRRWLRPATVLAAIFLADPRWAAYAGGLWLAWVAHRRLGAAAAPAGQAVRGARHVLVETALAAALAAPLAVPLLRYTALSTRRALQPADVFTLSLPWAGLLGALAPLGKQPEWAFYGGAAALVLAALALRRGKGRFWGLVALASVLWALGDALPVAWLARAPGVDLLRVPPRGLFLWGFALAVLAALGMEVWQARPVRARGRLWALAAVALAAALAATIAAAAGRAARAGFFAAVWLLAGAVLACPRRTRAATPVWGALLAVDLLVAAAGWSTPQPWQAVMTPPAVLAELPAATAPFRFYSPSYSLPQQVAAARGWELANGVDPLVLAAYADFLSAVSGVPQQGYSVVLPPLPNGDLQANRGAHLSAEGLGLLNVRFVVAAFPLGAPLQVMAHREGVWLYENPAARPRAWVEADAGGWRPATVVWTPNRVTVRASGPGRLVLSEVAYPGWHVLVDGQPQEAETAHGILRAVRLPAGQHEVVWVFRPRDLLAGALLALAAGLAVGCGAGLGL